MDTRQNAGVEARVSPVSTRDAGQPASRLSAVLDLVSPVRARTSLLLNPRSRYHLPVQPVPILTSAQPRHQLLLFDGECGLCDRTVQFLLARDHAQVLSYAPLQGETAAALKLRHAALATVDSVVLVQDYGLPRERIRLRSAAVLQAVSLLGGVWRAVALFRILPAPLLDLVYDAIARRRYRWFGKFDACRLPRPGQQQRFLR